MFAAEKLKSNTNVLPSHSALQTSPPDTAQPGALPPIARSPPPLTGTPGRADCRSPQPLGTPHLRPHPRPASALRTIHSPAERKLVGSPIHVPLEAL
ncbi:unnamed protein product [Rangifer tarandus platyrhynchus]|uniref:Uncharacterized protein n=2 Tax=Rangifer tarandus platyrhynchus TaxID=3082113 RepID=A0ACB0FN41_RANTA|nr:unnamed protein product [Rangifer tarandus platyrhynchus]CAI9714341.1 unnamed protein product [Rangifer tarandus platyrhynchus]